MTDLLALIEALGSQEYTQDRLRSIHGFSAVEAKRRSQHIAPLIHTALGFIHQAFEGPAHLSFLPIYYAVLNLAKVYVLVGPHHAVLAKNRWHGAVYLGHQKDSQNLLTESVTVKTQGTLPLFYLTLTDLTITKDLVLPMSNIYPYIVDISFEYQLATGTSSRLARVEFPIRPAPPGMQFPVIAHVTPYSGPDQVPLRHLKLLKGFKTEPGNVNHFRGINISNDARGVSNLRSTIRPFLLYAATNYVATPICSSHLLLPEEFPIIVMYFHLSNVIRYKPEFLAKLRNSKYWPMLLAARRHSLMKFLTLFWSFFHQQSLLLHSSTASLPARV